MGKKQSNPKPPDISKKPPAPPAPPSSRYFMDFLNEVCGNCGLTYGSHHGSNCLCPRDYCPGPRMDWENGPGTCFKPTNIYKTKNGECKIENSK